MNEEIKKQESESAPVVESKKTESPKTEEKKEIKKTPSKKDTATANGNSLHVSKKHAMYISNFIKGRKIDDAIADLQKVAVLKKAIPFKGEIPHRKGNMMSGRYPVNASKQFIYLLKGLKGNAIVNGMDLDKTYISISSASWASRPVRRGGVKAKRTNIILIAKERKQ